MTVRPEVLFVTRTPTVFAMKDRDILTEDFDVTTVMVTLNIPAYAYTLWRGLGRASVLYVYFAGWHALIATLLARLRGVPVVAVVGGYDVAHLPDIGYGARCSGWREAISRYVLEHADLALAFSDSARDEVLAFTSPRDVRTLHFGFDPARFGPRGERQPTVVTVGSVKASNLERKGHATFVEAARRLPGTRFVLIGGGDDGTLERLKALAPPNVEFTGPLDNDEVIDRLWRSQVYVQVSAHEGFGCSIAEAMLCGCVPVVTDRFAIPEVVGDTGYYVQFDDAGATADAVRKALDDRDRGPRARDRVMEHFPHQKRRDALLEAVGGLVE